MKIKYQYMTPLEGRRLVALHESGEWVEIYQGEQILVCAERVQMMKGSGLRESDGAIVYKTKEEALNAPKDPKFRGRYST